jgi:hypothetical protein
MREAGVTVVQLGTKRMVPCCGDGSPELTSADPSGLREGEPRRGSETVGVGREASSEVARATLAGWATVLRARLAQVDAVRRRSEAISGHGAVSTDGMLDTRDGVGEGEPGFGLARTDSPEGSEGQVPVGEAERDFVLRTFRVLGDPLSYKLLAACISKGYSSHELAGHVQLPEVAVWERVNDLIQLGLVQREVDRDKVTATPAGNALHWIVEGVVGLAVEQRSAIGGG